MTKILKQLRTRLDVAFKRELGIGMAQFQILAALSETGPSSQAKIAKFLFITSSAVDRHQAGLVDEGFITTKQSSDDKRITLFKLAPKGVAALNKSMAIGDRELGFFSDIENKNTNLMNHILAIEAELK